MCTLKNIVFSLFFDFQTAMIYKCSYSHDRGGLKVIWKSICFPLWSIQFCWYDEEAIMILKLSSSVNTPGDVLRNRPPLKFNMQPLLICVLWGCSSKSHAVDLKYKIHAELRCNKATLNVSIWYQYIRSSVVCKDLWCINFAFHLILDALN